VCLLLFALGTRPELPLVVAANRDELYARATAPADFWPERPEVLAGRDLEAGGTWLGVTRGGRFAALTNYRDPSAQRAGAPSRGALVADFLAGDEDAESFLARIASVGARYNGFNLVAGDARELFWLSNRTERVERVPAGVHGLSNHLLDTPWPKVERGRERLETLLASGEPVPDDLFELLLDAERAPDDALPETGVGLEWERALSPPFIASPTYGTRSSTVVLFREGEVELLERIHQTGRANAEERRFRFGVESRLEVTG
jgi:uncharacterized protein with NRDE domain